MPIMAMRKFERFFRVTAALDVDKNDVKRHSDFLTREIYNLLLIGAVTASANRRDIIQPRDLPVTKGLQESIHDFRKVDEGVDLEPILAELAVWPPLDLAMSDETTSRLPAVAGGLSIALARTFKIIDPELKNPQTAHWEQAFRIFDLLL